MKIGNTPIYEQFIGDTPIKNIWLGNTNVWTHRYDYELRNVELRYSDGGTYVKCDGSNYAYIFCTLVKKIGGEEEGSYIKYMNVEYTFSNTGKYLTNDGTNRFYFNIDEFGTEDMSVFDNFLYIGAIPYIYGISSSTLNILLEPNIIERIEFDGYKNDCWTIGSDGYISAYATQFTVYYTSDELEINYYKSGLNKEVSTPITSFLYDENRNLLASGSSDTNLYVQTITENNNNYPILFSYIVSHSRYSTGYDVEYEIFQKTKNSYDTPLALFDYQTRCYDDYYAYGSSYIKLVNDAHTPETQYSYTCTTQELTITFNNGIITIDGITSSMTDAQIIDITATLEDKQETITINVEYQ